MTVLWTKMKYLHMFHSCLQWTLRFTEDAHGIQCTWKPVKNQCVPFGFFPPFSFLKKSVHGGHLQRLLPKISSKPMISSKRCLRPSWETWRDNFFFFFIARLQLRVLCGKQRKVHPWGMRVGQTQRRGHEETILIHRKKLSFSKISTEASIFT